MTRHEPDPMTKGVLLRDVIGSDLLIFFDQQLDPDANYMAAFTARDPADRDAFTAHWARILGDETVTIRGLHGDLKPHQRLIAEIVSPDGALKRVPLVCRIDTADELDYFKNGGILQYVLRHLAA